MQLIIISHGVDEHGIGGDVSWARGYAKVVHAICPHIVVAHCWVPSVAHQPITAVLHDDVVLGNAGRVVEYQSTAVAHHSVVDDVMHRLVVSIHTSTGIASEDVVLEDRYRPTVRVPTPGKEAHAVARKAVMPDCHLAFAMPDARIEIL